MTTTSYWKRIYETVSGYSSPITPDIVSDVLDSMQDEIKLGLLKFAPYTNESFISFNRNFHGSTSLKEFVHDLAKHLKLDVQHAYLVLCNYLMFEFFGKIKEFAQITMYGSTQVLRQNVFNFYASERMFLLKTLRCILEGSLNQCIRFYEQYRTFVTSLAMTEVQDNLISSLDSLTNEITSLNSGAFDYNWLFRNNREQIEVILLLILTHSYSQLNNNHLISLARIFLRVNFSTCPVCFEARALTPPIDRQDCLAAYVACFFVAIQKFWDQNNLTEFWANPNTVDVDNGFKTLRIHDGHDIVMLGWLLLKARTSGPDNVLIYNAINKEPFRVFSQIISNKMFKNATIGNTVLKACYKVIEEICLTYNERKHLYEEEGFVRVLTELIRSHEIASICIRTRNAADTLLGIAIETFPYDFYSLTNMCNELLKHFDLYYQTLYLLNHVPSYLSELTWTIPKDEIYNLRIPQQASPDCELITFPAGTPVRAYAIFGRNLVQYRSQYSYFTYLEQLINELMDDARSHRQFNQETVLKVVAGFQVVCTLFQRKGELPYQLLSADQAIERFNMLIAKFDSFNLNYDLAKIYLKVHMDLASAKGISFFETVPEVVVRLFLIRIKGEFNESSSEALMFSHCVFEDTVFKVLLHEEADKRSHDFVLAYMKLIFKSVKYRNLVPNFVLSGVLYILSHVFMQHMKWAYDDDFQRTQITYKCLKLFHNILQEDKTELDGEALRVYELIRFAFLNNVFVVGVFMKLFVKERYQMHFLLEREDDWESKSANKKYRCIHLQLALLLVVLKAKGDEVCHIDCKIRTIVKPVLAYFTQSYSPVISELACRYLEKLARNQHLPLLALLELDHYQVQTLFLDRLRDPLEEQSVKLVIIDLVNTCINNQDGMTAAFFNLKCFMYWDGSEDNEITGDSVCEFMVEYLKNIRRSHSYFSNPLQIGILKLLVTLWTNHRNNLIQNITTMENFWPIMMAPFLCEFSQPIEVYVSILRIANMEMSANPQKPDERLGTLLMEIREFIVNNHQLGAFLKYLKRATEDYTSGESAELLSAWLEFVILTKKYMPESYKETARLKIVLSCLKGLNAPNAQLSIDSIYIFCQLFYVLISAWKVHKIKPQEVISGLKTFLHSTIHLMAYMPAKVKEIILVMVYRCITDLSSYLSQHTTVLISFLEPVGEFVENEYKYIMSENFEVMNAEDAIRAMKPWQVVIFIGNALLELSNVEQIKTWFNYRLFLKRIMSSVGLMIQSSSLFPFAKLGMDHMIAYAQSPLASDFLEVDLFIFYYDLRPRTIIISLDEAILSGVPVNLKEWWWLFTTVIRLNRILIHTLGGVFKETMLGFVRQNHMILYDIITLSQHTVDTTALTLVCETLKMVYKLLDWNIYWQATYSLSYNATLVGIKTTLNACILAVLGSKKINFYNITVQKSLDLISNPPNELLVSVLNKLISIIYWSTSCLRKIKPELTAYLNATKPQEVLVTEVDNDFRVPRFEPPITADLTYGALLCLGHYLCKVLNQLSPDTPTVAPRDRKISLTELNDDIKVENLSQIFEYCAATYEQRIGFMVHMARTDDTVGEKASTTFLHYEISDFSGASSVITQLDYDLVKNALESLMSFLSGEILFSVRKLSPDRRLPYTRELCSEMRFFYEFARKRSVELFNVMTHLPRPMTMLNEATAIQRYMANQKGEHRQLIDDHYLLILCQWLMRVCELTNL